MCVTHVADISFLVLLNLLVLEMRPLESFVIATVPTEDFDRRVRVSLCNVSAYMSMIQG